MKRRAIIRILVLITVISFGAIKASADLEVSASVQIHAKAEFDAPLSPYGTWVVVGSYGRCWRPAGVTVEWRPYCTGEWVWTDCGWYWRSDDPWGWACYHYGSWVFEPAYGWVWVPGVEWAPAWVSWRVGGGYIGWAPLGPPGWFGPRAPAPERFVFVSTGHFVGPLGPSTFVVKDKAVFGHTSAVGGVKRQSVNLNGAASQRVMFNEGPGADMIQKSTGKAIRATPITEAVKRTRGPASPRQERAVDSRQRHDALPDSGHQGRDDVGQGHGDHGSDNAWSPAGSGGGRGNGGGGHGKGRH